MDANTIMQLVGSLGFPIVASCAMFWLNYKQDDRHDTEIKQIMEAINNNTIAITKLCDRMEVKCIDNN